MSLEAKLEHCDHTSHGYAYWVGFIEANRIRFLYIKAYFSSGIWKGKISNQKCIVIVTENEANVFGNYFLMTKTYRQIKVTLANNDLGKIIR